MAVSKVSSLCTPSTVSQNLQRCHSLPGDRQVPQPASGPLTPGLQTPFRPERHPSPTRTPAPPQLRCLRPRREHVGPLCPHMRLREGRLGAARWLGTFAFFPHAWAPPSVSPSRAGPGLQSSESRHFHPAGTRSLPRLPREARPWRPACWDRLREQSPAGGAPALDRACLPCRRSCARRLPSLSWCGHPGLHGMAGADRGWCQVGRAGAAMLPQLRLEHQPLP